MFSKELKAIVSTTGMQMASSYAMLSMAAIAPLVAKDLDLPASLIGTYIGITYVSGAFSACICSSFIARYGAILVTQIALLFGAVGVMMGTLPSIYLVALGAVLIGIGYGMMTPASSDLLSRYVSPKHLGLVFSIKQSGVPLGFATAGFLTPLISSAFNWHVSLIFVGMVSILAVVLTVKTHKELDTYANPTSPIRMKAILGPLKLVIRLPELRHIAIICFTYCGMQLCILSFLVTFLVEVRHYDLILAGTLLSVTNVGGMFGRPFWGWVSDLTQKPRLIIGTLGLIAAGIIYNLMTMSDTTPMPLIFALCFCLGASAIGWNGVSLALTAQSAPKGRVSEATGGALFISFIGSMGFPMLFGFIERQSGSYETCFILMAICSSAIALWTLIRRLKTGH